VTNNKEMNVMQPRMNHPALTVPGAMKALQALHASAADTGLAPELIGLIELRASQINGCSVCVMMHAAELRKLGQSEDRITAVAAWRETPYFDDAERAALALTEAVTRLADRPDPVPDPIWEDAAGHFTDTQLAGLTLAIAGINVWNRLNAATRQVAGAW
jgi:AhpD family alkylhydroperoxidase